MNTLEESKKGLWKAAQRRRLLKAIASVLEDLLRAANNQVIEYENEIKKHSIKTPKRKNKRS